MSKKEYACDHCGEIFFSYPSQRRGTQKFCGKKCKFEFQIGKLTGESNPNFGNKWSDEQRKNASERLKKRFEDNPHLRWLAGTANRGVKFSEERIAAMFEHRAPESFRNRVFSDEDRALIGKHAKQRFEDPEYKRNILEKGMKTREDRGYITPRELRTDFSLYYVQAKWIDRMWELVQCPDQINLLRELGVWHPKENLRGVVRDHVFTRSDGYKNKVFPEILRHPCNCRIITHSYNSVKKGRSCISLDALFCSIEEYQGDWIEHDLVLNLIDLYRQGFRWDRNYEPK